MDFKNKYLKYKKKYLELKDLLGGDSNLNNIFNELINILPDNYKDLEYFNQNLVIYINKLNSIKDLTTNELSWRYFFIIYLFRHFQDYIQKIINTNQMPNKHIENILNQFKTIYNEEINKNKNTVFIIETWDVARKLVSYLTNLFEINIYEIIDFKIGEENYNKEDKKRFFTNYYHLYMDYRSTNEKPDFYKNGKYSYDEDTFNNIPKFLNGFDTHCNNEYEKSKKEFESWKKYIKFYKQEVEATKMYKLELLNYEKSGKKYDNFLKAQTKYEEDTQKYKENTQKYKEYTKCRKEKTAGYLRCREVINEPIQPIEPPEVKEPSKPTKPTPSEEVTKPKTMFLNDERIIDIDENNINNWKINDWILNLF